MVLKGWHRTWTPENNKQISLSDNPPVWSKQDDSGGRETNLTGKSGAFKVVQLLLSENVYDPKGAFLCQGVPNEMATDCGNVKIFNGLFDKKFVSPHLYVVFYRSFNFLLNL
jgi:hypothetical protein